MILVAAAALLALAATSAVAAPAGKWKRVTGIGHPDPNTSTVGVARTGDGVLHVLWTRYAGLAGEVLHSGVSAPGTSVAGPHAVHTFGDRVNSNVALLATSGGLRGFFSGLDSSPLSDFMTTATASDGTSWAVQPTPASNSSPGGSSKVYVASGIGAGLRKDGVPVSAWGDSGPGEAGYHVGTSPADPDLRFTSGCCAYNPGIGVDAATGQVVVAWKLIESGGATGTAARSVSPLASRVGLPGARATDSGSPTGITGRIGKGGVYVAYQRGTNQFLSRVAVWRFGAPKAKVLSKQRGARLVGISPAPGGRLWVFWMRDDRLYATRSNPQATKFGAVVGVKPVGGTDAIHGLAGEGSRGPLDLLALMERSSSDRAYWHKRVLPGLTLKVKKLKGGKVKLHALDAGKKLKGFKVKVGGKSVTTKGKVATLTLKRGRYRAKATKAGYTPARKRIRIG
jgi:hypothetical protein